MCQFFQKFRMKIIRSPWLDCGELPEFRYLLCCVTLCFHRLVSINLLACTSTFSIISLIHARKTQNTGVSHTHRGYPRDMLSCPCYEGSLSMNIATWVAQLCCCCYLKEKDSAGLGGKDGEWHSFVWAGMCFSHFYNLSPLAWLLTGAGPKQSPGWLVGTAAALHLCRPGCLCLGLIRNTSTIKRFVTLRIFYISLLRNIKITLIPLQTLSLNTIFCLAQYPWAGIHTC